MKLDRYAPARRKFIKLEPDLSERWVQELIAENPSILGLGDLVVRDKERRQQRAGRLDMLLEDQSTDPITRYVVEIQLGATDESHLVRCLEYWDLERRRASRFKHCAVIVAEDITSRFLNVIALFNSAVPLIAIQMQAYEVGEALTLTFTRVLDSFQHDEEEDEEDAIAYQKIDRANWERRTSPEALAAVDDLFTIAKKIDDTIHPNYNRMYIGAAKAGKPFNFFTAIPRKLTTQVDIKLPKDDQYEGMMNDAGIEIVGYTSYGMYKLNIDRELIERNRDTLEELLKKAFIARGG